MDAVFSWLLDKAPVIGIIVAVAVAAWLVSRYFKKLEDSRKKVDALPCDAHKNDIDRLSRMEAKVDSIVEQVSDISKWIMHLDEGMIDSLARKCSPMSMTKIGRDLFNDSGAKKTMDENADFLLSELEIRNPQTPFDVEDEALSVLLANMSHPMFNEIKSYLYYKPGRITFTDENGESKDVRVSMFGIVRLMGLDLRDRYLARHPEIK